MATEARHREISDQFLDQAIEEYRRGDMLQASEKAWGAVSHYVSAMSVDRGWRTGTHKRTVDNARRMIGEYPDPERHLTHFNAVMTLHVNFYQEILDADQVWGGIRDARALVAFLKYLDDVHAGRASFPSINGGTT